MLKKMFKSLSLAIMAMFISTPAWAGEASLVVPNIKEASELSYNLLLAGIIVSVLGLLWGLIAYGQIKSVKAHKSMIDIGNTIFETKAL